VIKFNSNVYNALLNYVNYTVGGGCWTCYALILHMHMCSCRVNFRPTFIYLYIIPCYWCCLPLVPYSSRTYKVH